MRNLTKEELKYIAGINFAGDLNKLYAVMEKSIATAKKRNHQKILWWLEIDIVTLKEIIDGNNE